MPQLLCKACNCPIIVVSPTSSRAWSPEIYETGRSVTESVIDDLPQTPVSVLDIQNMRSIMQTSVGSTAPHPALQFLQTYAENNHEFHLSCRWLETPIQTSHSAWSPQIYHIENSYEIPVTPVTDNTSFALFPCGCVYHRPCLDTCTSVNKNNSFICNRATICQGMNSQFNNKALHFSKILVTAPLTSISVTKNTCYWPWLVGGAVVVGSAVAIWQAISHGSGSNNQSLANTGANSTTTTPGMLGSTSGLSGGGSTTSPVTIVPTSTIAGNATGATTSNPLTSTIATAASTALNNFTSTTPFPLTSTQISNASTIATTVATTVYVTTAAALTNSSASSTTSATTSLLTSTPTTPVVIPTTSIWSTVSSYASSAASTIASTLGMSSSSSTSIFTTVPTTPTTTTISRQTRITLPDRRRDVNEQRILDACTSVTSEMCRVFLQINAWANTAAGSAVITPQIAEVLAARVDQQVNRAVLQNRTVNWNKYLENAIRTPDETSGYNPHAAYYYSNQPKVPVFLIRVLRQKLGLRD